MNHVEAIRALALQFELDACGAKPRFVYVTGRVEAALLRELEAPDHNVKLRSILGLEVRSHFSLPPNITIVTRDPL